MEILGIETSCDETAAAVVEDGTKILSNIIASSAEMHIKSGGVIPEVAARQQVKSIIPVIEESLSNSKQVDAIAVTIGPGLIGSLLIGIETARTLAYFLKKPIIPINHLVAHIYANWLNEKQPEFPALALVVSGGHTDLVLIKNHGKMEWIGGTRDDAAGEAFDKCARLLGLPYPGGPSIAFEATKFSINNSQSAIRLPRPIIDEDNFDWSFSGLKTAVLRGINGKKLKVKEKQELAHEIQEAITDVLVEKTLRAVKVYQPKSLILAGGVSANQRLREKFQLAVKQLNSRSVKLCFPAVNLCTDNAASIASCAFFNYSPVPWQKIEVNPNLSITGE